MRTALGIMILVATTLAARADGGPAIVIPGRPGVPIIINGIDASYAVVEGDWGLARGVHVQPTIYGGRIIDPYPRVGGYFPSAGSLPGYGRLEVEPDSRRRQKPAESYHQSWSAQSAPPAPAPAQLEVPFDPPPVIAAPQGGASAAPNFPDRPVRKNRD